LPAISRKVMILLALEALCISLIWYQSLTRRFSLSFYLAVSVALGALSGLSVFKKDRSRSFIFGEMLLLSVAVRQLYFIATGYTVLPWGDTYGEFGVLRKFLEKGAVFPIRTTAYDWFWMRYFSGWPGIQILAMALIEVSGIDMFYVALLLPWVVFIVWFVFSYLLFEKIRIDLGLSDIFRFSALLLLATASLPFFPPIFKYQDFALALLTGLFYSVYRRYSTSSKRDIILILIFMMGIIITHHYTSFMATLYFLLLSILISSGARIATKRPYIQMKFRIESFLFIVGLTSSLALLLWWTNFAPVVWGSVADSLGSFVEILTTGSFGVSTFILGAPDFMVGLTPIWARFLILLREIVLYFPALIGFMFMLLKQKESRARSFVLYPMIMSGALVVGDLLFGRVAPPERGLLLFTPFITVFAGFSYEALLRKRRYLLIGIAVILVCAAFMGQWGTRWTPRHLYDPTVTWSDFGEHPPTWKRVEPFFSQFASMEVIDAVFTDEPYMLSLIMQPDYWLKFKLRCVGWSGVIFHENQLLIEFSHLNARSYMSYIMLAFSNFFYNPKYDKSEFEQNLIAESNIVFVDGVNRIWQQ